MASTQLAIGQVLIQAPGRTAGQPMKIAKGMRRSPALLLTITVFIHAASANATCRNGRTAKCNGRCFARYLLDYIQHRHDARAAAPASRLC